VTAARTAGVRLRVGGAAHQSDLDYFHGRLEPLLAEPHVDWLGEVSHRPKVALLGDALATLFPIEWEEPFGLVMAESMLCGTPVIAFRRGSAPEIVDDGITGFLVDGEDEMAARLAALSRDPRAFDRRRCRAHAVRRFSADRMVDDYLRVYQALVGEPELLATRIEA
jgi:glycosyltransferase involved in cell wall biosynthesis